MMADFAVPEMLNPCKQLTQIRLNSVQLRTGVLLLANIKSGELTRHFDFAS
jgi:hypothetical protein